MNDLTVMQAMARVEGIQIPGSRAARNNNPGNLDMEPWLAEEFGAVLETIPHGYSEQPRFAAFPSLNQGYAAMRKLLNSAYVGMTIALALNKWAPPVENQTNAYIGTVCQLTGLTGETILTVELIG